MVEPTPADDSRFFEHGRVLLEACNPFTRQAALRVQMPNCLMQTVIPHLLNGGVTDELKVMDPVSVWMPRLTSVRFAGAASAVPGLSEKVNAAVAAEVQRTCQTFVHLKGYLVDPADVVPMLPLGVYVTFLYRCSVDSIPAILAGIDSIDVVGVHEFQWALATVLHRALEEFRQVEAALPRLSPRTT